MARNVFGPLPNAVSRLGIPSVETHAPDPNDHWPAAELPERLAEPDWRSLLPWERACILRNRRIRAGLAKWQAEHPPEPPASLPTLIVDMTEPPHCNIEAYYYRVLP